MSILTAIFLLMYQDTSDMKVIISNSTSTQVFEVENFKPILMSRNTFPLEKVFYVLEAKRDLISKSLHYGASYTFLYQSNIVFFIANPI